MILFTKVFFSYKKFEYKKIGLIRVTSEHLVSELKWKFSYSYLPPLHICRLFFPIGESSASAVKSSASQQRLLLCFFYTLCIIEVFLTITPPLLWRT